MPEALPPPPETGSPNNGNNMLPPPQFLTEAPDPEHLLGAGDSRNEGLLAATHNWRVLDSEHTPDMTPKQVTDIFGTSDDRFTDRFMFNKDNHIAPKHAGDRIQLELLHIEKMLQKDNLSPGAEKRLQAGLDTRKSALMLLDRHDGDVRATIKALRAERRAARREQDSELASNLTREITLLKNADPNNPAGGLSPLQIAKLMGDVYRYPRDPAHAERSFGRVAVSSLFGLPGLTGYQGSNINDGIRDVMFGGRDVRAERTKRKITENPEGDFSERQRRLAKHHTVFDKEREATRKAHESIKKRREALEQQTTTTDNSQPDEDRQTVKELVDA